MMVAKQVMKQINSGNLIRKMFQESRRLIAEYGRDNIYDFTLGNPTFEPPPAVTAAIIQVMRSGEKGIHRYMPNQGLEETRSFVAEKLQAKHDLPFSSHLVTMCVGAGGGLNIISKSLLNPADEVIVSAPHFPEYVHYTANHGGTLVVVPSSPSFHLDLNTIERAINPKTCAVLINSPNNPTGVAYRKGELDELGDLLRKKSRDRELPIYLISDEPYEKICYDGLITPSPFQAYEHTILVTSFSKDLAIPGERIGYVAVSPSCYDAGNIVSALNCAQLSLGFVNAPALMQKILPLLGDAIVDIAPYQKNRDLLYTCLRDLGVECVKPQGAFYLFPRTPIPDDLAFVKKAAEHKVMLVPGTAFGSPGFVRISYCFETEMIERSLPALRDVFSLR
ncbi:MAG: pyridoxal phosphate-dependent aminotransferase [Deltaproteobacteria bacterium]|nr:pyridoxal phosphate-dependent aminotransferase [Deltaproteobacteria bacterium]